MEDKASRDSEAGSRARGALYGLAIGDALGMPTQMLSRGEIRELNALCPTFHKQKPRPV